MLIFEQLQTTSSADGSFGRLCFGFETVVKTFKHPVNYFDKWKLSHKASTLEKNINCRNSAVKGGGNSIN